MRMKEMGKTELCPDQMLLQGAQTAWVSRKLSLRGTSETPIGHLESRVSGPIPRLGANSVGSMQRGSQEGQCTRSKIFVEKI